MSVSTPQKANMSASKSPSKSPSRRVLGDLTPMAVNTPLKHINNSETFEGMRAQSPLKQVHTLSPLTSTDKENAVGVGAFKMGRKRSINEVDGVEHVAHARKSFIGRDTDILRPTVTPLTETLASHSDPDGPNERGSTTEPDSPTPEPMEEAVNNSQASSQSFSNFVDWKECDSQPTQQPPAAPAPRKSTRADLLRLRLGFATYKVKTNQVEKSGSEILSTWENTSSSSSTDTPQQVIPSITLSPARPESAMHVKANLDPGRPIGKLSIGPVLLPTAYSSRSIQDYHVPSSPPNDLPKCVSPEQVMSPIRSEYRTPAAKRVLEEDYEDNSEEEEEEDETEEMSIQQRLQRQREKKFERGDLTSSAVKGNAAKGLLALMAGGR